MSCRVRKAEAEAETFQTTTLCAVRVSAADAFWGKPSCPGATLRVLERVCEDECFARGRQDVISAD